MSNYEQECKISYEKEISLNLKKLTLDKELSDVIFQVGPSTNYEIVYGIRSLFAINSAVFRSMLLGNKFIESNKKEIVIISDVTPESFKYLRNTFYGVRQLLKPSIVVDVLYLSQKYLISSLEVKCLNYIKEIKGLKAFSLILKQFENHYITKKSLEYLNNIICSKPSSYILSKKCKKFLFSEYFLNLNIYTVKKLISSDYLSIDECDVFKACLKYAFYNSTNNEFNIMKCKNIGNSNEINFDDRKDEDIDLPVDGTTLVSQLSLDDDDLVHESKQDSNIDLLIKDDDNSDDDGEYDGHKTYFDIDNNEIKKLIKYMINNKKMKEIFNELIKFIRFPIMDTNFIIEYIKNSNLLECKNPKILTSVELLDIFANKHDKRFECKFNSKERLCENTDSFCLNEYKLTLLDIYNLKIKDQIDFRDQYGLFCGATVIQIDHYTKGIKLHYDEWSDIYDEWIYYDMDNIIPAINVNNNNSSNNNNNNNDAIHNIDPRISNSVEQFLSFNNNNNSNNNNGNIIDDNNENNINIPEIIFNEKDYSIKQQTIIARFAKYQSISSRKVKRKEFETLSVNHKVLIKYPELFIQKYDELNHLKNKWVEGTVVSYRMEKKYSNHVKVRCEINQDHYDWWFHPDNDDEIKPYKNFDIEEDEY